MIGVTFLFRVGLAIIQCCKPTITATADRDMILNTLLHPPSALLPASPDTFVELALALRFKDDDVRKQRAKLEAQSRRPNPVKPSASVISLPQR